MILLDTSILSSALRRKASIPATEVELLRKMIVAGSPPSIPGIVIQELLSGIKEDSQLAKLRNGLESFPLVLATLADHISAAALFNKCRRKGVAATLVDCLIAAQAIANRARLWTLDRDFLSLARLSELALFEPDRLRVKP